jgi:hypothetical protein
LRNCSPLESSNTKKAIVQEAHLKSLTRIRYSWLRIQNALLWSEAKGAGMMEKSIKIYSCQGMTIPQQSVTAI